MSGRRWVCPTCGNGVLAPARPRRDDVRRYCLRCSEKTGRLVERTCPAADRKRQAQTEKRAALTSRKRERARESERAHRTAGPYDLLAEARRFAKLPAVRLRHFPDIELRRSTSKEHSSGHCYYGWPARIVVTVGTNPHDAAATMLHEIVHAELGGEGHSTRFWDTVRRAAREAWPGATFKFLDAPNGWQTQRAIANGLQALYEKDPSS